MTNEYGDGSAPMHEDPSAKEKAAVTGVAEQRIASSEDLENKTLASKPNELAGFVAYVTYKKYAYATILAKAGTPVKAPMTAGTPLGLTPLSHREGDIKVKFVAGVCTTNVPEVILWCEEHKEVCRRADDPRTRAWEALKSSQVELGSREALIDGAMPVDEIIYGDAKDLGAALADSQTDDVVAAALASQGKANVDADKPKKLVT